ncbi:hypothetical protein BX666DRAFT_2030920 [Dichotomocladium elegans]|nr:hypothetical protein BX666DRAFT_2030920 [Dichotomocladium elegans]
MIEPLEPAVVRQLRASLHITTLLQCLKELVYNALDAEASLIEVYVDADRFTIRVDDDGKGIRPNILWHLAQPYVTTRCHTLNDLESVNTFGYRGQALANLADLGILQVLSRCGNETAEAIWKDGKLIEKSTSCRRQQGTTVIVRDLFYKFPARRRVLTLSGQSIKRFIITVALAFPHIGYVVYDGATKILSTKRAKLVGCRTSPPNLWTAVHTEPFRLQALFGLTAYPTKIYQYIFLNRHYIPPNLIYKVVSDTFASSSIISQERTPHKDIKKGKHAVEKHPVFIIHIDDPSLSTYDITLYRDGLPEHRQLDVRLQAAVRELTANFLRANGYISSVAYQRILTNRDSPSSSPRPAKRVHEETSNFTQPSLHIDTSVYEADDRPEPESFVDKSRLRSKPIISYRPSTSDLLKIPQRLNKEALNTAVVLGQVDCKFIAIKLQGMLLLVDQHAADERIQLERALWSVKDRVETMQLESPIFINLSADEQHLAELYKDHLHRWGFHISSSTAEKFVGGKDAPSRESYHTGRTIVTRLPRIIADRCIASPALLNAMICEYVHWLEQADGKERDPESESFSFLRTCPPAMMAVMRSKACRGAVMFNDPLTFGQCCWLIEALSECRFPFQCVHGRFDTSLQ